MANLGLIAIGRNEGDRLMRCLNSVVSPGVKVIYVDSGSTDGSVDNARKMGVRVLELDLSIPFTAARARNEGFEALLKEDPEIKYVQFIDGDCEVVPGWLEMAQQELVAHSDTAVVCGRRRERFPKASIYNALCDMEWDTPVGLARASGGDAMMRVDAYLQAGGFDPGIIAAEDDELCLRIRRHGWLIRRIDADMVIHDAAMFHFSQWWKRAVRCGYAFALGASIHGSGPERHFIRERRRILMWGFAIPLLILLVAIFTHGWGLLLALIYPLQIWRIYRRNRNRASPSIALAYGVACIGSKFAEFVGLIRFLTDRLLGRPIRIIEYK